MVNGDVEVSDYELVVAWFADNVVIYYAPIARTVSCGRINCYYNYYCLIRGCDIKIEGVSAINFCEG